MPGALTKPLPSYPELQPRGPLQGLPGPGSQAAAPSQSLPSSPVVGWGCCGHPCSAVLPMTEKGSTPRALPPGPGRKGLVSGSGGRGQVGWGGPQHRWNPSTKGPGLLAPAHKPPSQAPGSKLTQDTAQALLAGTELRAEEWEGPPGPTWQLDA